MGSLKLTTASSGSVILSPANTASDVTITVPAVTGTMDIQGPAFSAYLSSNTAFTSGTTTKVTLDTEIFDTANCFSSSRFTPNVAGYYQINGKIRITGTGLEGAVSIYKNGSLLTLGTYVNSTCTVVFSTVSVVVYLNGTTDYVELYGYASTTSGSPTFQAISVGNTCEMNGCLVRAA